MRSGDAARRTNQTNPLAGPDCIAVFDGERRQVLEQRKHPEAVIDHDGVPGKVQIARQNYAAGVRGDDRRTFRTREIFAGVRTARDAVENAPRTESAARRRGHRLHKRSVPQSLGRTRGP